MAIGAMAVIKESIVPFGLVATILIGYGTGTQAIKDTKAIVKEVKISVKENRDINVEQTIALTKQSVILEGVVKTQEKQNKFLDKLLEKE